MAGKTKWTVIAVLALVVIGGGLVGFLPFSDEIPTKFASLGLCVIVSMLLSALPLLISYVQTTSKNRQITKLTDISDVAVAQTSYYQIALKTLKSIQPATIFTPGYAVPIIGFGVVVMFGCLMVFLGGFTEADLLFQRPTFLLGGMTVIGESDVAKIAAHQKSTLLVGGIAFIAAYISMLARLLDRINNNDIYPISYYYYIVGFVTATLVAMIFRNAFPTQEYSAILLIAFAIGFVPDLFIGAMLSRAYQIVKVVGAQKGPEQDHLPTNMSLLMIEGISRDKVSRLAELGIDNAQILANQNPFIIWPRLPYSLTLIVNWIAQAQLYDFVKESGIKALRAKGINNICDLAIALKDATASHEIATIAGLNVTAIDAYIAGLEADPCFRHLKEVRDNL